MIDKIVIDTEKHIFETTEKIVEKLEYFKSCSLAGLDNLSESERKELHDEFNFFLNIDLSLFSDSYPTKLFRIIVNKRLDKNNPYKLQKITDLIGPPEKCARMGRANGKGEGVFYAALDFSTAIWETQPDKGDFITVCEWKIKEGQKLVNHYIFHPIETNLSEESKRAYEAHLQQFTNIHQDYRSTFIEILKFIAEEFMKPVDREKNENYLFSSLVSSRFLQRGKDSNGFQIESISYPSTRRDCEVTNIAILNSLVLEKLDLVSVQIMTVGEINYDETNKTRHDLIMVSPLITEAERFDFENNQIHWNLKKELEDAIRLHEESEKLKKEGC